MTDFDEKNEYRNFFELNPCFLFIADLDGNLKLINKAWTETLGYKLDELVGRPLVSFVHPDDVHETGENAMALRDGSQTTVHFQNRFRKADGSYLWLSWAARIHDQKIYALSRDISNEKEQELFFSRIQKSAKIGGWSLNLRNMTTAWSDETYRIHEVEIGTPTDTQSGINFYHPEDQPKITECVKRCIEDQTPFDDVFRITTAKGKEVWVRAAGSPILDSTGKVEYLVGTFQDVDKQTRVAKNLEQTKKQLQDVLDNSPGMVYQFKMKPQGEMYFTYASQKTFDIYEIEASAFQEDPALMLKLTHPDDKTSLEKAIQDSAKDLSPFEWVGRINTAKDNTRWIKATSIPNKLKDDSVLWNGIVVDISHEKELEHNLAMQQKITEHTSRLASIGELAAGVGHEINNPLSILIFKLSKINHLLKKAGVEDKDIEKCIDDSQNACERIKNIVAGMRTLSHSGENQEAPVGCLRSATESTVLLVKDIYRKESIHLSLKLPEEEFKVDCSETQLQQIVLNLLSNAKDALNGVKDAEIRIKMEISPNQEQATLAITDNGSGIPEDIQPKIFEAFFTSKDVGLGTGIGLSMCRSITEAAKGSISFETGGWGTTFKVTFPLSESSTPKKVQTLAVEKEEKLNIMIVDDEDNIREMLSEEFKGLGCNVYAASSGLQALLLAKKHVFDMILSDVRMPGMDGFELLDKLNTESLCSDSFKALMTGGQNITRNASQDSRIQALVLKPFDFDELAELIVKAKQHKATVALKIA